MKKLMLFEQFLFEKKEDAKDLYKVYLAIDPKSGHRWWSYKDFAGNNFFIQLTLDNYKDVKINPDFPVLNYNSKVTKALLKDGLIKKENIYNKPDFIKQSGSKVEFHKIVDGDENIPLTVYSKDEAVKKIGFPMIAKPKGGHSGLGIQIFKTQKDFDKADHEALDLYSQYVDKKSEHRIINFDGKAMYWMERIPMNGKAKSGDGKGDEQMMFKYILRDPAKLPQKYNDLIAKYCKMFSDLPYITFDVMEDKSGKLFVIESNAQPGVPFDSTIQLYHKIFEDFYGRPVDQVTKAKLDEMAKYMIKKTLELDPERFEVKK
jgi:hypothetical protein